MYSSMERICKSVFCFFLLSCIFTIDCFADELTRRQLYMTGNDTSIIRHYKMKKDVVCVRSYFGPFFMMQEEGVSSTQMLFVEMSDVTDFEIYNDTVYFCGKTSGTLGSTARVGFFPVSGLSTLGVTTVSYLDLPWMEELKALEVSFYSMRKHLVTIGETMKNEAMLVDAIDDGGAWNVNYSVINKPSVVLRDLAVTDTWVVVTSTSRESTLCKNGIIFYFKKPSVVGAAVTQISPASYNDLGGGYSDKFIIRTINGDVFATAYIPCLFQDFDPELHVMFHPGMGYGRRFVLTESHRDGMMLQDMAVERGSEDVQVLVTLQGFLGVRSVFYRMPINGSSSVIPVDRRTLFSVYMTSLSPTDHWNHFVSFGYNVGTTEHFFAKYEAGSIAGGCLSLNSKEAVGNIKENKPDTFKFVNSMVRMIPISYEVEKKESEFEDVCTSQSKTN